MWDSFKKSSKYERFGDFPSDIRVFTVQRETRSAALSVFLQFKGYYLDGELCGSALRWCL